MKSEIPEIEELGLDTAEKKKSRSGAGVLALLLSFIAVGVSAWIWWQMDSSTGAAEQRVFDELNRLESRLTATAEQTSQLRDQLQEVAGKDSSQDMSALNQRLAGDRSRVDELERLQHEQAALSRSLQAASQTMHNRLIAAEASLSGLSNRELDAGGELDLAEVDYLLRLANERLQLFTDPVAANQALLVADQHLEALDNPIYLGVRRELAQARQLLAELDLPDYMELSHRIDEIQATIPALPFEQEPVAAEAAATESGDSGWWSKLKGAFSGLVTVRRTSEDGQQRISLEDKDFIRQRLWLQLEIAHLSLMRRDQVAWEHAIDRMQEALSTWFAADSTELSQMQEALNELRHTRIWVEVPDITGPWSTLRTIRAGSSQRAPLVPPSAPVLEPAENTADQPPDSTTEEGGNSTS